MGGNIQDITLDIHNLPEGSCTDGVICDLAPIDISGQADPCNTVSVPVRIEENGECVEGATVLDQLAQAIGQCLGIGTVDTDVQNFTGVATGTDTATLTITEDATSLPVFLRGDNIEFSGSGTAADPLRMTVADAQSTVVTEGDGISVTGTGTQADPYVVTFVACGLDVLTQTQVNAASSVLSVACVDNQTVLIPVEEPVITDANLCSLPVRTQGQVDAASTVLIAACVDDTSVLIPPPTGDPVDPNDAIEFEAGEGIDIGVQAIANGVEYTVELDLCELPDVLAAIVQAEPNSYFAMCIDGVNRKLRVDQAQSIFGSLVTAGNDISVTGDGSQANPYVINSTKETIVQSGTNTTVTGNGDVGNPYIVNSIAPPVTPSFTFLPAPVTIFNIQQALSDGSTSTGVTTINLNSLAGVTVPAGATGVILKATTAVSGDQLQLGNGISGEFTHIEAAATAGQINGGDFATNNNIANLISYADTNLGGNDNDDISYPIIPLNGTSISYIGKIIFQNTVGNGLAFSQMSLRIVGFTL